MKKTKRSICPDSWRKESPSKTKFSHLFFVYCPETLLYFHALPWNLALFSCIALKPYFIFMYCPETLLYFHVLPWNLALLLKKPIEQFSRKICHRWMSLIWYELPLKQGFKKKTSIEQKVLKLQTRGKI